MIRKSLITAFTVLITTLTITAPIYAAPKTTSNYYTMSAKVSSIDGDIIAFTDSRGEVWEWELDADEDPTNYKLNRKCTLAFYDCETTSIYDDEITEIIFK